MEEAEKVQVIPAVKPDRLAGEAVHFFDTGAARHQFPASACRWMLQSQRLDELFSFIRPSTSSPFGPMSYQDDSAKSFLV